MKRKYWVLLVICFGILLIDQWTKHVVQGKLFLHQAIGVIPGFFNLVHVRNTGGAFGIFGGERGGLGSLLFVVVSLIAVGSILVFFIKAKEDEKSLSLSLSSCSERCHWKSHRPTPVRGGCRFSRFLYSLIPLACLGYLGFQPSVSGSV